MEHYQKRIRINYNENVGSCKEYNKLNKKSNNDQEKDEIPEGGYDSKSKLIFNLHPTASTHIFIKSCESFRIKVKYGVITSGKINKEHQLDVHPANTFIAIRARSCSKDDAIVIILEHFIPKPTLGILSFKISDNDSLDLFGWNNIGIVVGSIVFIFIPIIVAVNPSNLMNSAWVSVVSALLIFGVSILFIIKGWLFSKDMNINVLKYYDFVYQALILLIFAELIGVLYAVNII
jgi:hypothetical protein